MRKGLKFCLLSAIATGVVPVPALAQDSETADASLSQSGEHPPTIVVTARKREENLIDVPLPITVATEEQLKRDQVYSLNDLQRVAPALEISQTSGGESNGGGRLRGLGTGIFNPSVASSVAFVIDQVPIGNLAFPQLFDLAQIEVLRGPQGTLFGQGASAGVVNVTTRAPDPDGLSVNGSVDYADKGTAGAEVGEVVVNGGFNMPLGPDAAIRVASQYKKETGLQRSVTTGKDNEVEDFGVRVRALMEPSPDVTINLSGEYAKNTQDGQTFFAIAIAPNSTDPFGPPGATLGGISTGAFLNPDGCGMSQISERAEEYCEEGASYMTTSVGSMTAVIDLALSDTLSLTSVSGYRERSFKQFRRDFSRITGTFSARQERTQEDSRGFSQELRLSYTARAVTFVAGAFYNDYRFDRVPTGTGPFEFGVLTPDERIGFSVCQYPGVPRGPVPIPCVVGLSFTKETTENRTLAGFADATVSVSDQFDIFGGIRYTDYKNTTGVGTDTLVPTEYFITKDDNISGRIGVSFKPDADMNFFGSYSRGYKPPAVGTNPAGDLFQLKPEQADAFELGAKFNIATLQLAANVFYTEIKNFQSQTSVFVGTALISNPLNIPKLKSKGFELSLFGELFTGFNINAGYQYNDVKYPKDYCADGDIDADLDGVCPGSDIGGTQFLNAPKHKVTLSGDYGLPLSDDVELFVNANVVYKSDVLLAARSDPRYRYPAHELVNGGIGIRHPDGNWYASIFARNLTKEREPTAYLANTFAGQIDGGIRAWPVAGLTARVIGLRVGFDY